MRVIAVDFDGCLCRNAWPNIGKAHKGVIRRLIRRKKRGDQLILWTCRDGELLIDAIRWCKHRGLTFDEVNENIYQRKVMYGNDSRKVSADEYWDDRAVRIGPPRLYWKLLAKVKRMVRGQ